ncbi:hypothetical protein HPC49_01835 [Pyxidicoccus fallax]|uniref:Lipoprotein n=1 Tax=Pyxidicoccus fallax TaxID=394095 RepID=A0A848LC03_9BACT|nr:hypothetical protein [Pyxidicoccus fallax]NMO13821.1 hypothetical protein [Pyxidicoccus fallax]NPC76992.1 hypothetical protein [Pyxidicoccus fallax]
MQAKRSAVRKSWLHLCVAAGAVLAIGCGSGIDLEEGEAPAETPTVRAQSEECPGSQGYCEAASGSVFCGPGRPRASAFQTSDGGWCIHWTACGMDRPICDPSNTEN